MLKMTSMPFMYGASASDARSNASATLRRLEYARYEKLKCTTLWKITQVPEIARYHGKIARYHGKIYGKISLKSGQIALKLLFFTISSLI